ncbi:hypothetical protein A3B45_01900 [Candidatus Daviesbacteria bacterium RIFCSPLOWO2_01_FULL_39_12]|uniref:Type 4 fimbrial biogenesis protein PilX N-terminal domain-containing protein n=1 Tax=Candidatus Daviesbacteria bacterium RIFCSPLOWO2_01_FULL_39_12 TaxID=1797785 RepID=A0A1F5KM74_9BACT|nr:MAG: hypothetical protein A3B45_01900 [Candidatus Daviesbacteria bacterium RIFCSPLOWO2_01_FULL_39_12]
MRKKFQSGQIVLILLLVITIGLGIGLSVIQRSITNVSTSTKVEESSRAFSAAEAGIEQALVQISQGSSPTGVDFTTQNQSKAVIETSGLVPALNQTFETPPISKEEMAQVWLATPSSAPNPASLFYDQSSLDIYWGNSNVSQDPAVETSLIYIQNGEIKRKSFYFDPDSSRASGNGFSPPGGSFAGCPDYTISTSFGANRSFACKATLSNLGTTDLGAGRILLLTRARIFYTNSTNPVAFAPTGGGCGQSCSFPPQATIIVSTGTSGATQRRVQLFKQPTVLPWFFDFAIFSLAAINK